MFKPNAARIDATTIRPNPISAESMPRQHELMRHLIVMDMPLPAYKANSQLHVILVKRRDAMLYLVTDCQKRSV